MAVGTGAHKRLCQALLENCQNDPMSDIEEVLVFSNFFYIYRRWPIGPQDYGRLGTKDCERCPHEGGVGHEIDKRCPTSPHDVSRAIGH